MPDAVHVSLAQLLDLGLLPGHEVIGGADGLQRPLTGVVPGVAAREVGGGGAGVAVVFDPGRLDVTDPLADVAVRLGHQAGIAGLILQRPDRPVPLATRHLADKFGLPLILLEKVDVGGVVATLDAHVRRPEAAGARLLGEVLRRLRAAPQNLDGTVGTLAAVLRCPIALVDSDGRHVGGAEPATRAIGAGGHVPLLGRPRPGPAAVTVGTRERLLLQPLGLTPDGPANLWLAALLPAGSPLLEAARNALGVGAWAVTSHLATESLAAEREGRLRALLLTEILEHADAPARRTVERATGVGWRLSGWHTSVQVAVAAGNAWPGELVPALAEALSADLVERLDGWAFWRTHDAELPVTGGEKLATQVRHALLAAERDRPGLRLCAGIGRSRLGSAGLKESLADAAQACMLARARDVPGAVEHIDGMSVTRLLAEWYGSGSLRRVTAEVLAPLTAADPAGDLLRTLATYLDHESSATTAAVVLGIHRNTVLHRLARIRELLPLDLADPDERLVAHLATRVARVDPAVTG